VKGELTSPSLSVTGGVSVTLSFWYWREVEWYAEGSFDKTYVQVKYGSEVWQTVWELDSKTPSQETWTKVTQQSTIPAGISSMQVRFVFDSMDDIANNFAGWFVDDVAIETGSALPAQADERPVETQLLSISVTCIPNPITDVHTTTFVVTGPMSGLVKAIKVQIFDLSGRLVYESGEIPGTSLDWHTENQVGETLANGVYLYRMYALIGGEWIESKTKKLAILR
jgi:hypothetical protein